jgi:hypothetical protein
MIRTVSSDTSTGAIVNPNPRPRTAHKERGSYDTSPDPIATAAVGAYRLSAGLIPAKVAERKLCLHVQAILCRCADTYNRRKTLLTSGCLRNSVSQWCANCHHHALPFVTPFIHSNQALKRWSVTFIYNTRKTGDLTGTNATRICRCSFR